MREGSALDRLLEQLRFSKNLCILKRVVIKSQRENVNHKSLEMSFVALALSLRL